MSELKEGREKGIVDSTGSPGPCAPPPKRSTRQDSLRARVEALEAENERLRRAVDVCVDDCHRGLGYKTKGHFCEAVKRLDGIKQRLSRALRAADGEDQHG